MVGPGVMLSEEKWPGKGSCGLVEWGVKAFGFSPTGATVMPAHLIYDGQRVTPEFAAEDMARKGVPTKYIDLFVTTQARFEWDPSEHPRGETGSSEGGRFVPKGEGGGGGGVQSAPRNPLPSGGNFQNNLLAANKEIRDAIRAMPIQKIDRPNVVVDYVKKKASAALDSVLDAARMTSWVMAHAGAPGLILAQAVNKGTVNRKTSSDDHIVALKEKYGNKTANLIAIAGNAIAGATGLATAAATAAMHHHMTGASPLASVVAGIMAGSVAATPLLYSKLGIKVGEGASHLAAKGARAAASLTKAGAAKLGRGLMALGKWTLSLPGVILASKASGSDASGISAKAKQILNPGKAGFTMEQLLLAEELLFADDGDVTLSQGNIEKMGKCLLNSTAHEFFDGFFGENKDNFEKLGNAIKAHPSMFEDAPSFSGDRQVWYNGVRTPEDRVLRELQVAGFSFEDAFVLLEEFQSVS